MTADLHTRLRTAIQEKLDLARAATGEWHRVGFVTTGEPPFLAGPDIAEHIAAHDPAAMIRLHEAALRALDIHAPQPDRRGPRCAHCQDGTEPWPCAEFEIVADAYGVPLDTEEAG